MLLREIGAPSLTLTAKLWQEVRWFKSPRRRSNPRAVGALRFGVTSGRGYLDFNAVLGDTLIEVYGDYTYGYYNCMKYFRPQYEGLWVRDVWLQYLGIEGGFRSGDVAFS